VVECLLYIGKSTLISETKFHVIAIFFHCVKMMLNRNLIKISIHDQSQKSSNDRIYPLRLYLPADFWIINPSALKLCKVIINVW
jgi:hypothetical protein